MVGERGPATIRGTPALKQFAVDVDNVFRTRGFVQTIHVLRAEKQAAGSGLFGPGLFGPLGQRDVRCVRFGIAGARTTIRIVLPNQFRIALPGFNVRQFVMAVAAPVGPLKDRNPAFRADSGPGQDKNAAVPVHTNCSLPQVQSGL